MKKFLIISVILGVGWYGNYYYRQQKRAPAQVSSQANPQNTATTTSQFRCDGRMYCSQMRSCAEAKFFLANCPDVKMDGNNDGVPCEKQWCH